MKKCMRCDKELTQTKGAPYFCSLFCRKTYDKTPLYPQKSIVKKSKSAKI